MKYTKDDLAKMSDDDVFHTLSELSGSYISEMERWSDIMPLAIEHDLNILSPDSLSVENKYGWNCFNDGGSCDSHDTNPQRAIACCLILVLQERE